MFVITNSIILEERHHTLHVRGVIEFTFLHLIFTFQERLLASLQLFLDTFCIETLFSSKRFQQKTFSSRKYFFAENVFSRKRLVKENVLCRKRYVRKHSVRKLSERKQFVGAPFYFIGFGADLHPQFLRIFVLTVLFTIIFKQNKEQ